MCYDQSACAATKTCRQAKLDGVLLRDMPRYNLPAVGSTWPLAASYR